MRGVEGRSRTRPVLGAAGRARGADRARLLQREGPCSGVPSGRGWRAGDSTHVAKRKAVLAPSECSIVAEAQAGSSSAPRRMRSPAGTTAGDQTQPREVALDPAVGLRLLRSRRPRDPFARRPVVRLDRAGPARRPAGPLPHRQGATVPARAAPCRWSESLVRPDAALAPCRIATERHWIVTLLPRRGASGLSRGAWLRDEGTSPPRL